MSLSEQIIAALRARNASGETYKSMHQSSGITQSYIHGIVNRKYDPLKMSLLTFAALFPRAVIYLDGADAASDAAAVDLSDYVSKSDYAALRDKYQDLRDQYQDLRDQYQELKSRPPYLLDGPGSAAPYHTSASSKSK
jgi:hypothetical protein